MVEYPWTIKEPERWPHKDAECSASWSHDRVAHHEGWPPWAARGCTVFPSITLVSETQREQDIALSNACHFLIFQDTLALKEEISLNQSPGPYSPRCQTGLPVEARVRSCPGQGWECTSTRTRLTKEFQVRKSLKGNSQSTLATEHSPFLSFLQISF